MKVVIFGLTISSSWGNGHATLWRGLCRVLAARGARVVFYERDVAYYAAHRDLRALPGDGRLVLYAGWDDVHADARRELADADAAFVTSYCPDGPAASRLVHDAPRATRIFYDMDTPVTLDRLARGEPVPYLPPQGLADFDLVLSFTGGRSLDALRERLGARRAVPLYGSVDPAVHHPAAPQRRFAADLSYLGTYAADRQEALERLCIEPARRLPARRFVVGGAQYPADFPWRANLRCVPHVAPVDHPAFFASSPLTLNVTRRAMAETGYCPSGRLFEAAACGTPVLSDWWEGLDAFFTPGEEILVARDTDEALEALARPRDELARIGRRARERALDEHTAESRTEELMRYIGERVPAPAAGEPA